MVLPGSPAANLPRLQFGLLSECLCRDALREARHARLRGVRAGSCGRDAARIACTSEMTTPLAIRISSSSTMKLQGLSKATHTGGGCSHSVGCAAPDTSTLRQC